MKRASAPDATTLEIHELLYLITKIKIKDIMAKDPITVLSDFSVEETAEVLLKNRISGVPVMVVNPYKIVTYNKNKTDAIPHLVNYYMAFKMLVPYSVVKPL
ncbi:MAG: CBS domain-containing protein [Desulfobacterales bacterium]